MPSAGLSAWRAARDLIWLGLGGLGLWLPNSAAAQAFASAAMCALLAAMGLLLLAAWMLVHQPSQPRRRWAGLALALALWQGLGMHWLGNALAPDARSAFGPLLVFMWVLNGLPLIGLGWGLCAAAAAAVRRWPGLRRAGLASLTWLAWPLAWTTWALWREELWWGGNYAGLALRLLDLPGSALALPVLGASLFEGACWALALAIAQLVLWGWQRLPSWRVAGGVAAAAGLLGVTGVMGMVMLTPQAAWSPSSAETSHRPNGPVEPNSAGWTRAAGAPVSVVALQPAALTPDWNLAARDQALSQLHGALAQAAPGSVLVTSETFLREPPPPHAVGVWQDLLLQVQRTQNHLLLGLPLALREAGPGTQGGAAVADDSTSLGLMNTVLQISPSGPGQGPGENQGLRTSVYAKQRLAPVGEAMPWPALLRPLLAAWFLQPQQPGRPDMQPGPAALSQPLFVAGHTVGISICHELAFGSHLRRLAQGADWLLNVADDSWITDPDYRLQVERIARLRALELGKPLLRVSQGAPSVLIGTDGQVLAQAPSAGRSQWPVAVQPVVGSTPYGRMGGAMQLGVLGLVAALLLGAALVVGLAALRTRFPKLVAITRKQAFDAAAQPTSLPSFNRSTPL